MQLGAAFSFAVDRRKTISGLFAQQIWSQYVLRFGADKYYAVSAMMLGLMRFGPILPNFAIGADVIWPNKANLRRPAAGETLETNHIGDDRGQVWQRRLNSGIGHRLNAR